MQIKRSIPVLIGHLILIVAACKGSNSQQAVLPDSMAATTPSGVTAVQMSYEPTVGGVMGTNDMSLSVPAQATQQAMTITATRLTNVPAISEERVVPAGVAYEFGPHGTDFDLARKPTLTIKYDPAVLSAQGISESNLMVYYYDSETKEYVAEGGEVNTTTKTITVGLEHFSVYLLAAQQQAALGNTPPVVGAYTCLPSCGAATTRANAPLYVRSVVTDPDPAGSLAEVTLYYRILGSPTYTAVPMQIDQTLTPVANRYGAVIPASAVTAAGVQYYVRATDNLNAPTQRAAVSRTPTTVMCSMAINSSSLNITAGFRNTFTLSGTAGPTCPGATAVTNLIPDIAAFDPDSPTVTGNLGNLKIGSNGVIFEALKATPVLPVAKPGTLRLSAGPFTQTATISVKNGTMQTLQILDENSLPFSTTINITPGYLYNFDIIGRDAYGNAIPVLPNWSRTGTIGNFTGATTAILNTAGGSGTGSVTAILGSMQATQPVGIYTLAAAPASFTATAGNQKNSLSWNSLSGANGYNIYFTTDGSLPSKTHGTKVINATTSYEHSGLTNGTSYRYIVTAYNAGGESVESSVIMATPVNATAAYRVFYNANGATSGTVPLDTNMYPTAANAVVMGNPGNLMLNTLAFAGWNTQPDGSGTTLSPGDTLLIGATDITLYAQLTKPTFTITYVVGDITGGTIPVDNNRYTSGSQIILPDGRSLLRSGYRPNGWVWGNDPNVVYYEFGRTFVMGTDDVVLAINWSQANRNDWAGVCSSADGTILAAIIPYGYIYTSNDSGATWIERDAPRGWAFVACSADGTKMAAADQDERIYISVDSGITWSPRGPNNFFSSVAISDDGTKLAATAADGIYTSGDSGLTWLFRGPPQTSWRKIASSADGMRLAAITHIPGPIYVSLDSGISWITTGPTQSWRDIASSADGTTLVAITAYGGFTNAAYVSVDSGITWVPRTGPSNSWESISISHDGTKMAAVSAIGNIYTSSDIGVTWATVADTKSWSSIASSSNGTKLVAVSRRNGWGPGRIYASNDSGLTWVPRF